MEMEKCPVCGMNVDKETALHSEHAEKTYYFCGAGCKETFEKNPEKFAVAKNEHHSHGGCC